MDEPVAARPWHRLPWLVLGSAMAAVLVKGFDEELATEVRLALLIPGIVYMANAVGTQTGALVIRGLSVGGVFRLEVIAGLLVGLVLGALSVPAVWLVLGAAELAITVGPSLVAVRAVAMSLPWLMSQLGRDPAFGSGPLATVAQDLLSLLLYFAIAGVIMG